MNEMVSGGMNHSFFHSFPWQLWFIQTTKKKKTRCVNEVAQQENMMGFAWMSQKQAFQDVQMMCAFPLSLMIRFPEV